VVFLALQAAGLACVIIGGLAFASHDSSRGPVSAALAVLALLYAGLLSRYFVPILRSPTEARRNASGTDSAVDGMLDAAFAEAEIGLRNTRGENGAPMALSAVPWLAVVADPLGAEDFLRHITHRATVTPPREDAPSAAARARWHLAPEFAALKIDLTNAKGRARETMWTSVFGALAARPGGRAIDGILAPISADTLQGSATAIAELGAELGRISDAAQSRLQLELPIIVVATRCDRVPGIGAFTTRLGGKALNQALGWWPSAGERQGAADRARIAAALDRIEDRLRAVGLALVAQEPDPSARASIWSCVEALVGLREGLECLLNAVLGGRPAARLGGVFLVGDAIPGTMAPDTGLFVDDLARRFVPRAADLVAAHASSAG
jgi:type VI protein secretion system component VasK